AIPGPRVSTPYLYHFLRTVDFYRLAPATTVPALRKSDLERIPIPLPGADEQRRIAEILDQAEALQAKRRAALAQIDVLTQSIFLDLFAQPVLNQKGWPTVSIGEIAEIIVPTRDKPKRFVGDIPWVTLPDIDGLFVVRAKNMLTKEDAEEVGNRLI